ncbi:DUF308 domain-containing protein [Bradyrhizobium neotropicale]|uniref:DUF308 domain-containing protein n=1 Tax=Bradyrhizobium neotropicale TaxID=1497615 RepID=UPI001AD6BD75|nr:DUF308 domain-containing protein [Bradyrhizobium neotropicale]MBO4221323.1 DUF308 domain-containing protein [Bradyrhizobium neotropicale]
MMVGMLVAGFGLLLAGLLAIGYGIQYKEFSVGSTLILSGVFGFCTGLIMFGLWLNVRELRNLARRLGTGVPEEALREEPHHEFPLPPVAPRAAAAPEGGFPFRRGQPAAHGSGDGEPEVPAAAGATPPPWYHEAAARDRARNELPPLAPPGAEPSEVGPAGPKRRNLMFSSTRKERERAQPRAGEPLTPDMLSPEPRSNPLASAAESGESQQVNFDDTWPRSERQRPSDLPPRRVPRTPLTPGESPGAPVADRRPPQPQEQPPVTVLKSGVVDGMAYSLYSDGSIEAQMPEGMMRFASIDELRSHLEQRSS